MPDLLPLIFLFLFVIPSSIIHEYAHAWMADRLGDQTARYAGRLTLNPVSHIDLYGTIIMPLVLFLMTSGRFVFAAAKPVPFNPYNLRDQKWGPVWVAFAGPTSNFLLALVFGLMVRYLPASNFSSVLSVVVYANVILGVFNLVPIPPLDGSKFLFALLPDSLAGLKVTLERFGFIFLLIFIFMFSGVISPVISFFYNLFTGGAGLF